MTECRDIREQLPLWAGDDLPQPEAAALEAHLESCTACRAEATRWRADLDDLRAGLAGQGVPLMPADRLAAAASEAAARVRPKPILRRRGFWAAAVPLAAVLVAALLWRNPAPGPDEAPRAGVSWPELQETFAGCLERPVPLEEWEAGRRAGVVTVLAPAGDGERFVVADCLEMSDLSRLRAYPWAEQRIAAWRASTGGELLVTVCPTDDADRGERRRLRRDVLARYQPRG